MTNDDLSGSKTFDTGDPAALRRLQLAWDNFEHLLDQGGVASDLDADDLDYLIADLVAIRHRGLAGIGPDDTVRTCVAEQDGQLILESHAYSADGWDWKGRPLTSADREEAAP